MKKYFNLIALTGLISFNSCNDLEINREDYATFEATNIEFGVDPGGESTNGITVYTNTISNSNRTFNVLVITEESNIDIDAYTVPLTVTIPSGTNVGKLPVTIQDLNIEDNTSLVLKLEATDNTFTGENITLNIFRICYENELIIRFVFDDFPEETSWELFDASNNLIASENDYSGKTTASEKFCLVNGSYRFVVYDAFEDGFCCGYGNGSYTLSHNGNIIKTGGEFNTQSEETEFNLPLTP